jgi:hypothetical protein
MTNCLLNIKTFHSNKDFSIALRDVRFYFSMISVTILANFQNPIFTFYTPASSFTSLSIYHYLVNKKWCNSEPSLRSNVSFPDYITTTLSHMLAMSSIYRLDSGGPLQPLKWKEQHIQTTRLCSLSIVTHRTSKKLHIELKIYYYYYYYYYKWVFILWQ